MSDSSADRWRLEESVDRILESLIRINVTLESLRVSLSVVSQVSSDHEGRLRAIERWKYGLTPLLTGVAFILGNVVNLIFAHVW